MTAPEKWAAAVFSQWQYCKCWRNRRALRFDPQFSRTRITQSGFRPSPFPNERAKGEMAPRLMNGDQLAPSRYERRGRPDAANSDEREPR